MLFGTFQSLKNKDAQFFTRFEACICDEAHHTGSSASIKGILEKCINSSRNLFGNVMGNLFG